MLSYINNFRWDNQDQPLFRTPSGILLTKCLFQKQISLFMSKLGILPICIVVIVSVRVSSAISWDNSNNFFYFLVVCIYTLNIIPVILMYNILIFLGLRHPCQGF